MSFFAYEIVTPPAHLPVTVAAAQTALAAAVVEEMRAQRFLWRGIIAQHQRRILIDGPLPQILKIEPATAIVSLTRWTPAGDDYSCDPRGSEWRWCRGYLRGGGRGELQRRE